MQAQAQGRKQGHKQEQRQLPQRLPPYAPIPSASAAHWEHMWRQACATRRHFGPGAVRALIAILSLPARSWDAEWQALSAAADKADTTADADEMPTKISTGSLP